MKVILPEEKKSKLYKLVMSIKAADIKDLTSVYSIVYRVSSWTTARGAMARFLNAHLNGRRELIMQPPDAEMFQKADNALLIMAMPFTRELEREGKLESISPVWESGICWMTGRFGNHGAYLIMLHSHSEDHRMDPGDALYRSRKYAYIVGGRFLAIKVKNACAKCKVMSTTLLQQKMEDLPPQIFDIPASPWTHITLDFLGPWSAKQLSTREAG